MFVLLFFFCFRILCNVWLYFSQYHVISLSLAIIRGRKQLFKSLYKFTKKTKINSEKLVRFFPLIALILDIYKSRHDFNLFVIITIYLPGFYATNFIYTIIEILGVLTIELQRLNKNYPEKHYHLIYKAICNINSNFGLPIFNHVLLTTLTGLFFCYTHTLDAIKCYKQESIVVANVFAPDFWCISTIIATVSLARTTHKLKKIQSSRLDDELHLWQRHLEKMELSAWDLFTIGNHIFIGVSCN